MASTFNTAVRETYHEIGRYMDTDTPMQILERVGWFFEKLTDWYNNDFDMSLKQRESFWMAIADSAFSAYINMSGKDAEEAKREVIHLMIRKQHDYGSKNILTFGERGVLVRCCDKYARLCNLLENGKEPNYESIADTWLDMCNYGVIATMVLRNQFDLPFDYAEVKQLNKEVV